MPSYLKFDWRLTNQEQYLKGVSLRMSRFTVRPGQREWDHEHCEFCWAKIVEEKRKKEGDDLLIEGYATEDRRRWICPQCFSDFREMFQWTVVPPEEAIQSPQRNAGSRPFSDDSPASESPSSLGPRG